MEVDTAARTDHWLPVLLAVGLNVLTLIGMTRWVGRRAT